MFTNNSEISDVTSDNTAPASRAASEAAAAAYDRTAQNTLDSRATGTDTSLSWLPETQFFDSTNQATDTTPATDSSTLWPVNQAETQVAATELQTALYDSWTPSLTSRSGWSYDFDAAWRILENKTPEEIQAIDQEISSTFGQDMSQDGEKFGLRELVAYNASDAELGRFDALMEDKQHNDVPQEFRTTGDTLIRPGSELTPGEVTRIELGDRHYQVYVPKNADSRAPVVVAMHGAAGGDGADLALNEMGMISAAERTGSIVVFAEPKVREFDMGSVSNTLGLNQGVAWNVPGYQNLPAEEDNSYSDADYLNAVIDDLKTNVETADKVGLAGFSDGARMAEVFASLYPDRVSAVYSGHGTWMDGDALPTTAVPIKIVMGTGDQTLPMTGGLGNVSGWMDWAVATNLANSQPMEQIDTWTAVNECAGSSNISVEPNLTSIDYDCTGAPVEVEMFTGAAHAWHDYGNLGPQSVQWVLGEADRTRNMGLDAQTFLIENLDQQAAAH